MFFQVLQWHVQWQSSSGGGQLGHGPNAEEVLEDQAGSDQGHREERRWVCGGIWCRSWCQIGGMSTLLNVVKWPLWISCRWKCNITGPGFSFSDCIRLCFFLHLKANIFFIFSFDVCMPDNDREMTEWDGGRLMVYCHMITGKRGDEQISRWCCTLINCAWFYHCVQTSSLIVPGTVSVLTGFLLHTHTHTHTHTDTDTDTDTDRHRHTHTHTHTQIWLFSLSFCFTFCFFLFTV